jgi:hypothetical protein
VSQRPTAAHTELHPATRSCDVRADEGRDAPTPASVARDGKALNRRNVLPWGWPNWARAQLSASVPQLSASGPRGLRAAQAREAAARAKVAGGSAPSVSLRCWRSINSRMEVDGMLAIVDWLGLSVESFVRARTR